MARESHPGGGRVCANGEGVVGVGVEVGEPEAEGVDERLDVEEVGDVVGLAQVRPEPDCRNGRAVEQAIRGRLSTGLGDLPFGERYLQAWVTVRSWLNRRLPAQVAEVDDPLEALVRLRDQLESLEQRLSRQEQDLRGASEDIARGIDVQVRKARGQVNRLNKNLDSVSFGSIRAIRVRMEPDEGMERVLRALRDGAAQELSLIHISEPTRPY